MYLLVLVILLSGAEAVYSPEGPPHKFADKAACEAQAAKSKPAIEKDNPGMPFKLECRKA